MYSFKVKQNAKDFNKVKKFTKLELVDKEFIKCLAIPTANESEPVRYYFLMKKQTVELIDV